MDERRNLLGVMQGRLLPKYRGRYQAHPTGYWKEEFSIAKSLELDCIEFIVDLDDIHLNPLMSSNGIQEIEKAINSSGVLVKSVCADYLMDSPLHSPEAMEVDLSLSILKRLIQSCRVLGIKDIVIPCVDNSSLAESSSRLRLIRVLRDLLPLAERYCVNFSLETDLPPDPFAELLSYFESERVTVNYDIGNSASLGYNCFEELRCYGEKISDIHIKDRSFGGGSVLLGSGAADFDSFFERLADFKYKGLFIMQAYRDDEGISIFRQQLDWIKGRYLEGVWI